MNEKRNRKTIRTRLRHCGLLALCFGLLVLSGGCSGTARPEPVVNDPAPIWLVERTVWPWQSEQTGYETLPTEEEFFADPPTIEALKELQVLAETYGYDFPTLRAEAWEWLQNVERVGQ